MDSNHDIVPTLRLNGGVYMSFAADEIERLRARVALLERRADTSLIPGAVPTHRCKVCGAYWRKWNVDGQMSWNLCSCGCGECCDNAPMGDQIEALSSPARVGGDEREAFEAWWKTITPQMYAKLTPSQFAEVGWRAGRAAMSADGGEDKRDAERYRWCRKRYIGFDFDWMADNDGNNGKQVICFEMDSGMRIGVDINDAIDAAIAANQSGKGGE